MKLFLQKTFSSAKSFQFVKRLKSCQLEFFLGWRRQCGWWWWLCRKKGAKLSVDLEKMNKFQHVRYRHSTLKAFNVVNMRFMISGTSLHLSRTVNGLHNSSTQQFIEIHFPWPISLSSKIYVFSLTSGNK